MLNFIYGLILILFQFTVSIANGHIDVFPSFIGFGLIAIAFRANKHKSKFFDGMLYPTIILMVLTTFTYIINIFGLTLPISFLNTLINFTVVFGNIAVVYGIVMGLRDIEAKESFHLNTDQPLAAAHYYTIIQVVVLLSISDIITAVALSARIVSIVYLVYTLYKSVVLYNQKNSFNQ